MTLRERALRTLKATAWVVAAATLLILVSMSRLRDRVHDELGPLGARVAEWGRLARAFQPPDSDSDEEGERVLVLNGQEIEIATRIVEGDLATAMEALRRECPEGDTREQGGGGYFLCIEDLSAIEWPQRVAAFADSQDVAELGKLRYTYAEPDEERGIVLLVTMRPVSSFRIDEIIPDADQDVAGADPTNVPRVEGLRRVLSAYERGEPYGVTMYGDASRDPDALRERYRAAIDPERFTEIDLAAAAARIGETYDARVLYLLDRAQPGAFVVMHFEPPSGPSPFRGYVTIMEAR
ncbi:MAG: hypothetical protein KF901_30080 [Myxococcales bacterium]|nr:hypothetical protein [Myxococcales bacterium]